MKNLDPRKRSNLIPRGEKGKCRWCFKPVPKGRRSWCSQACVDDALIRTSPPHARAAVEKRDKGVCSECGLDTKVLENQLRRIGTLAMHGITGYERTKDRAAKRYGLTASQVWNIIAARITDFEAAEKEARHEERPQSSLRYPVYSVSWEKPLPVTVQQQRIRVVNARLKRLATARLKRLSLELAKQGFDGISARTGIVQRSMWDADHIIPVVKGGGGCGLENYRTLCQPCHKGATKRLAAERALERRGPSPQTELPL